MASYEAYSKRRKRALRGEQPAVYHYDDLPERFRIQVLHVLQSVIGEVPDSWTAADSTPMPVLIWNKIHEAMLEEVGAFNLYNERDSPYWDCRGYFMTAETDQALDFIEIAIRTVEEMFPSYSFMPDQRAKWKSYRSIGEGVERLNQRFQEHDLGYSYVIGDFFEAGTLTRADSQYMQSEVVEPAIGLLHTAAFQGALDEFMDAHRHYRKGDNKAAIFEAAKAFESTLKAICGERDWSYPNNATAATLVDTIINNGLIPRYLESQLNALRTLMQSGLPTLSNRTSRHGQGVATVEVSDYVAGYALHLAASNIIMLVEAHRASPTSASNEDDSSFDDVPF